MKLELKKPVTKRKILYDSTYVRYLQQSNSPSESRMVVAEAGEGENGKLFNAMEF